MKRILVASLGAVLLLSGSAFANKAACKWTNPDKAKDHVKNHITYPATGKQVKESCKKEMPDEFTASERACVNKLPDKAEYKTPEDVMKAVHLQ